MSQQDPGPFRLFRCLLAAVSGFFFTAFFFGSLDAWREISLENWNDAGLGWLKVDYWARTVPFGEYWKESAAGGLLTLILALAGEGLRGSKFPLVSLVRWGSRIFGRLPGFLSLMVVVFLPQGLAMATRPAPPEDAPNLVFVMVNTWRADHTSFLGYQRETWPEVGKLAGEGIVFERAIAQAPWTKPSVATCFTGKVPSKHGVMSYMPADSGKRWVKVPAKETMFTEVLAASGYETMAVSNNFNIQPWFGYGQGFRRFSLHHWDVDAGDLADEMSGWLDDHDGDRPFFAYLHVTDPHYPYHAPEPFAGKWDKSGSDFNVGPDLVHDLHAGNVKLTNEEVRRVIDAYDEELAYTDWAVGKFIREVREKFPNTVVVLVGDHGDEFLDHGALGHGHILFDELTRVPLLFWAPDLEGRRVKQQVRLLDIVPTTMELLGQTWPEGLGSGESLVEMMKTGEGEDLPAPMETGGDGLPPWQRRGIVMRWEDGRLLKMIREELSEVNKEEVEWSLYDLEADPQEELRNLYEDEPKIAEGLFEYMKLRGWYTHPDDLDSVGEAWNQVADAEAIQALKDGGYMGGDEDEDPAEESGERSAH